MLVRRLLRDRLGQYYAQPAHAVVGSIFDAPRAGRANDDGAVSLPPSSLSSSALPFSSLWGEWHWKMLYRRLYEQQKGQWLTPVELFRPYYSRAVARWAVQTVASAAAAADDGPRGNPHHLMPWEIIEVGGGRGTNASVILDLLKARHPALYEACVRYTLVDASPTLHELQHLVLQRSPHHRKVKFRLLDLMDVAEGRESLLQDSPRHTVVIALEVLDNLPHDKVRRIRRPSKGDIEWEQVEIDEATDPPALHETFRPLSDPLLRQIVLATPRSSYGSSRRPLGTGTSSSPPAAATMWIPSVACGLMLSLARDLQQQSTTLKQHSARSLSLLAADFDWLPPPDKFDPQRQASKVGSSSYKAAVGEPLVMCMDGYDHQCYLNAPILSDVLFPTDFGRLAEFGRSVFATTRSRVDATVAKQSGFLRRYDDPETSDIDQTKSWLTGYTPLLEDFANCSVLTLNVSHTNEEDGKGTKSR